MEGIIQKNTINWIKKHFLKIISIVVPILYFFFMLKYYLIEYYVPDFGLYSTAAINGYRAFDGFSSTFVFVSGLATINPKLITILCLLLMTLAIFHFLDFYITVLCKNSGQFLIFLFIVISCGIWYYFFGKTFYDWPFTIYFYGLCMASLKKIVLSTRENKFKMKYWYIFCGLIGYMFSWKPYNLFLVAGLGLCMLCYDEIRNTIILPIIKKDISKMIFSFLILVVGYIAGNFNFIIDPIATINGIKAYPAQCDFKQFMIQKQQIIWDQICNLPFNISVMNVITLLILIVVMPICIKKVRYIIVSIFIIACLYIYISFFSPGYVWHGFAYAGSVLTITMFVVSEIQITNKFTKRLIILAIIFQCTSNFCFYVPIQDRWFNETKTAIEQLENNEEEIAQTVYNMLEGLPQESVGIDCALKRFKPINLSAQLWNLPSRNNTYISIQNRIYTDPLMSNNYAFWSKYEKNYIDVYMDFEYYIYIMPNAFYRIGDVVDLNKYAWCNVVETINSDDYTIILYQKV